MSELQFENHTVDLAGGGGGGVSGSGVSGGNGSASAAAGPSFASYDYNAPPPPATAIPGTIGGAAFDDEPPLLEELGINFAHIYEKTYVVLHPLKHISASAHLMDEADLAGPLVFALVLGACLLLTGKVHFGYIYGVGLVGTVGVHQLVSLMSERQSSLSFFHTVSFLGYSLLPIVLLAALAIVVNVNSALGYALAALCIAWCTKSATDMFVAGLEMQNQKALLAYPILMVYTCFAFLTIF